MKSWFVNQFSGSTNEKRGGWEDRFGIRRADFAARNRGTKGIQEGMPIEIRSTVGGTT